MENHGYEVLMIMISKVQLAVATVFQGLFASAMIVLMDTAEMIITAYLMIALHVISGWVVMLKSRNPWDKEKWFKTCMKLLWFPILIIATKWLKNSYSLDVPLAAIVSGFLAVNELKGFVDNVGRLTGIDIWNAIADQIDWKKFKLKDRE